MNRTRLLAITVVGAAFWGSFGLGRFYDDWTFVSGAMTAWSSGRITPYIWSPIGQHWSPAWHAFQLLNFAAVGWQSDVLIRSLTIVLAVASVLLFLRVTGALGLSPLAGALGAVILAWHHANALPYYAFDAYSQLAADLASWAIAASVLGIALGLPERFGLQSSWQIAALGASALLVKEQALSAVAYVTVIALWFQFAETAPSAARRVLWTSWGAVLSAAAIFAAFRVRAGIPLTGSGDFTLCLRCVPRNAALLVGAPFLPMRSMNVYFSVTDPVKHPGYLAFAIVAVGVVALLLLSGIRRFAAERTNVDARRPLLFAALLAASSFPTSLLARIGVLYVHTALFWFAVLAAYAVDGWRPTIAAGGMRRRVAAFVLAATFAIAHFVNLRLNLNDIRASGARAAVLQSRFGQAVRGTPAGAVIVVRGLDRVKKPGDYSVIRLTTPGMLLNYASTSLPFVAPPGTTIVDEEDWAVAARTVPAAKIFVASFVGDEVIVQPPATDPP